MPKKIMPKRDYALWLYANLQANRLNMSAIWTNRLQRRIITVIAYIQGGTEGRSKLKQRPLISSLPLCRIWN